MRPSRTLIFLLLATPSISMAEFENASYSYLGLGQESLSYSESTRDFGGLEFKTKFHGSNLVQRSGGYTAIEDKFGFFLSTSSTLLAQEAKEQWNFPGIGTVQEDQMSVKRTAIDISGVYHLQNGHFFNLGSHYNSISFSRFNFASTPQSEKLNEAIFSRKDYSDEALKKELKALEKLSAQKGVCITNSQKTCIGAKNPDGTYTVSLADYKEAKRFNPAATAGVVFEDMASWSIMAGWGYDSYFIRKSSGLRYQFSIRLGTAVFESVLNTKNNKSLSRTFGGDLDIHALAGIGYQFRPEFGLIFSVEYNAVHRNEIREGKTFLPKNDFTAFSPQLTANWAF